MGIYEGLDKIKQYREDREARREAAQANKIVWFSNLVKDGESVKIRFLQELDRGAENYSEKNGLGIMVTEHSNPDDWHRKALCSMDAEGQCLGCEKHAEDWRAGWSQKPRLIINVLVEKKDGTREVAIMSQSNGTKAVIAPMILDYAIENNTLTDRWWKMSRTGEGTATNWTPMVFGPSDDVDPEDYEVFDVKRAVKEVAYDEQFDFYFKEREDAQAEKPKADSKPKPSGGGTADEEW
jgi:hypothetical protein